MSFRKWMLTFLAGMFGAALLLCAFNVLVDPFGVFGDKVLQWHSYNMVNNPRTAKIAYLDQYHDRYDSYVIGGSKSSSLPPELLNKYYGDARFYSMMMYGGDFDDYEKTLYYLANHYEVKNIILHISMFEVGRFGYDSADVKEELHAKVSGASLPLFYLKYLTLHPRYGIDKLQGYAERRIDAFAYSQIIPETGVYNKTRRDAENVNDLDAYLAANPQFSEKLYQIPPRAIDENVASLRRMKAFCEERGIDFRVVTGATYYAELERYSDLNALKTYWKKLAEVTDFWDFSGYTPVSFDPRHYYDPSHYRNSLGEMMLGYMFDDPDVFVPEGFGHLTTRDNVGEHAERIFTRPPKLAGGANGEKKVPILMYHHLVTDPELENASSISPDKFAADMRALKEAGFTTIFLSDLVDYVYEGKALPDKPVAVTFDDGYLSNYEFAYPVLAELDMKATISVIGWSVGETKYKGTDRDIIPHFTWEQAREMVESGHIDIQNHTYDMHNPNTPEEPSRRGVLPEPGESSGAYARALAEDVLRNERNIERHVGNDVFALAYPYGEYTFLSELVLQDLGYKVTLSTRNGINTIRQGDPLSLFALKRINAGPDIPSAELVQTLERLIAQ